MGGWFFREGRSGIVAVHPDLFTERLILNCSRRICEVLKRRHARPMSRRNTSRLVFLIFVAALVSGGAQGADSKTGVDPETTTNSKTSADSRTNPVSPVGPGLPFAIADLDGDLRPDLANIQTGRSD